MPSLARPAIGPITSGYGWRTLNGVKNFHNGLDFGWYYADVVGSRKVYSVAPGTVVNVAYSGIAGNYVLIDLGGGYKARYIHLSRTSVTPGQRVGYSTPIGVMGDTGSSTSQIHLHLDLFYGSNRVNPEPYMTLPFGYKGLSPSVTESTPIEQKDNDMAHFDLIRTPDGTVWWCVDRVTRYAIPSPENLATYRAFHKELKGVEISLVDKSHAEINAYGAPVFSNWLERIPQAAITYNGPSADDVIDNLKNRL